MSDELTPSERRAMDALPREIAPPGHLEDQIVMALRRGGALERRRTREWRRPLAAAAAAVVLLVGGAAAGRWTASPSVEQPEFLLLLRAGKGQAPATEEEMTERVHEYGAWARSAHQDGVLLAGEKLTDDGRLISPAGILRMEEDLSGEDAIEGYFLIRASDYPQAEAIASTCPHIKYGGEIELRRIHSFAEESS